MTTRCVLVGEAVGGGEGVAVGGTGVLVGGSAVGLAVGERVGALFARPMREFSRKGRPGP